VFFPTSRPEARRAATRVCLSLRLERGQEVAAWRTEVSVSVQRRNQLGGEPAMDGAGSPHLQGTRSWLHLNLAVEVSLKVQFIQRQEDVAFY
jgi:hypothetical protein